MDTYSNHSQLPASIQENQELLHSSLLSSHDSAVKVEISDVEKSGECFLTGILRRCNQQVLRPYWRLLIFITWRPFARDRIFHLCPWRFWNILYPIIIICLLIFSYVYSILVCVSRTPDLMFQVNVNPLQQTQTVQPRLITNTTCLEEAHKREQCHNLFSNCIMPNFLHFLAFLYGLWYFRIQENEQIHALIEQVFLQANPMQRGNVTQASIIKSLRLILLCGALWTGAAVGINGLYVPAFKYKNVTLKVNNSNATTVILLIVELVGKTVQHLINTAVVVNFTVQCEVIIYYMRIIGTRMQEKTSELKAIMNDILRVKQSISKLNGAIANMTSLCIFYFALRFVIGMCLLILNEDRCALVWAYWSMYCAIWFVIMFFPLCQAARVNATCKMYQQEAHEVRVFGYRTSTQVDLDSFLLFITSIKLKVKLFCMPIRQAYVCGAFVIGMFSLAILLLTDIINPKDSRFF